MQLQGPNGSGKTSLIRILCGLARPASGRVTWNDIDVHREFSSISHKINYVGHRRGVCEDLSPLENLIFASDLHTPVPQNDCLKALAKLGLESVSNATCRKLSAGQIQRTALARLLVRNATLWCLDEPFTALDTQGRAIVESMLSENAENGGISIVATHQPLSLNGDNIKSLHLDDQ